jgi:hypothetical protein
MIVKVYSDGQNKRKFRGINNTNDIDEINAQAAMLHITNSQHSLCDLDNLNSQKPDKAKSLIIIGHGNPSGIAGLAPDLLVKGLKEYIKKCLSAQLEIIEITLYFCNAGTTCNQLNFSKTFSEILSDSLDFTSHIQIKAPKGMIIIDKDSVYVMKDNDPFVEDKTVSTKIAKARNVSDLDELIMQENQYEYSYAVTQQFFSQLRPMEVTIADEMQGFTKTQPFNISDDTFKTHDKHYTLLTAIYAKHETKESETDDIKLPSLKNLSFYRSSASGSTQSQNGAELHNAPGLRS